MLHLFILLHTFIHFLHVQSTFFLVTVLPVGFPLMQHPLMLLVLLPQPGHLCPRLIIQHKKIVNLLLVFLLKLPKQAIKVGIRSQLVADIDGVEQGLLHLFGLWVEVEFVVLCVFVQIFDIVIDDFAK